MSKPNVTRVQSATQWTASVHTLHMSKPNVTRVQSATQWTASVHTLHMSKSNLHLQDRHFLKRFPLQPNVTFASHVPETK